MIVFLNFAALVCGAGCLVYLARDARRQWSKNDRAALVLTIGVGLLVLWSVFVSGRAFVQGVLP
jgi:hypothetical protein